MGASRSPMDRLHERKELELLWHCGGARWLSKREKEQDESTLWRLLSYVKTLPYSNRYILIVLFTICKRVFRPLLQKRQCRPARLGDQAAHFTSRVCQPHSAPKFHAMVQSFPPPTAHNPLTTAPNRSQPGSPLPSHSVTLDRGVGGQQVSCASSHRVRTHPSSQLPLPDTGRVP